MLKIHRAALKPGFPICALCNRPVELETAKTDEQGHPVHEQCYVQKVRRQTASPDST